MIKSEILRKNNISYFLSLAIQELKSYGYDTERLNNAKKGVYKNIDKIYNQNPNYNDFELELRNYIASVDDAVYVLERELIHF